MGKRLTSCSGAAPTAGSQMARADHPPVTIMLSKVWRERRDSNPRPLPWTAEQRGLRLAHPFSELRDRIRRHSQQQRCQNEM